jgi:tryptophan halogenase
MNIVVAGGGTAGWLTALYAKKVFPKSKVTVIESEEIGILGAGEGSTPILWALLNHLDISIASLIKNTGATVKNSVKFTNWTSDGGYYHNPFQSSFSGMMDENFTHTHFSEPDFNFQHIYGALDGKNLKDYSMMERLSEKKLVPFTFINGLPSNLSVASIHFNARDLAIHLRKIAESRKIKRVEGIIKKINADETGTIKSLTVNDNEIALDFVFDCTGFQRLIIGKFFNSQWNSYKHILPAKKAIPFFDPTDEDNLPPYTEAIAMNYGWMWKIPVQGRYGCGYVFDSDFISDDQAKKELDDFVGYEVSSPRTFSFEPGSFEKVWINNCLAVGLSSGFVEPLEATSIMQSIFLLKEFLKNKSNITTNSQLSRDKINNLYKAQTEGIVDFLYLHYVTNKNNTEFWSNFTKNNKMPKKISDVFETIKERPLSAIDFTDQFYHGLFGAGGFMYILIGNKLIHRDQLIKYKDLVADNKMEQFRVILIEQDIAVTSATTHKKFIEYCQNNNIFI